MRVFAECLGKRIRQLRKAQKLRGKELAAYVGCDPSWISHIEAGDHTPSMELLQRIAQVLAVDEMDLCTFPEVNVRHEINELTRHAPPEALEEVAARLRRYARPSRREPDREE